MNPMKSVDAIEAILAAVSAARQRARLNQSTMHHQIARKAKIVSADEIIVV